MLSVSTHASPQSELVIDDASPLHFGRQPVGRFATIRRKITNNGGLTLNFMVKHANTGAVLDAMGDYARPHACETQQL